MVRSTDRPTDPRNDAHTPHQPISTSLQVDTGSADVTTEAVKLASAVGTPVRSAGPGYNMPTYFRIAVREPGLTKVRGRKKGGGLLGGEGGGGGFSFVGLF